MTPEETIAQLKQTIAEQEESLRLYRIEARAAERLDALCVELQISNKHLTADLSASRERVATLEAENAQLRHKIGTTLASVEHYIGTEQTELADADSTAKANACDHHMGNLFNIQELLLAKWINPESINETFQRAGIDTSDAEGVAPLPAEPVASNIKKMQEGLCLTHCKHCGSSAWMFPEGKKPYCSVCENEYVELPAEQPPVAPHPSESEKGETNA